MNDAHGETVATIEQCAHRAHAGTMSFGEVVQTLAASGVEAYFADYRGKATTYYLATGQVVRVTLPAPAVPVAEAFDAASVQAAIRGAQSGEIKYPEFVQRTMSAGCMGYVVWIAGRHVQYFGRRGEAHVEHFPSK